MRRQLGKVKVAPEMLWEDREWTEGEAVPEADLQAGTGLVSHAAPPGPPLLSRPHIQPPVDHQKPPTHLARLEHQRQRGFDGAIRLWDWEERRC